MLLIAVAGWGRSEARHRNGLQILHPNKRNWVETRGSRVQLLTLDGASRTYPFGPIPHIVTPFQHIGTTLKGITSYLIFLALEYIPILSNNMPTAITTSEVIKAIGWTIYLRGSGESEMNLHFSLLFSQYFETG